MTIDEIEYEEFNVIELADLLRGKNRWVANRDTTDMPDHYKERLGEVLAPMFLEALSEKMIVKTREEPYPHYPEETREIASTELVVLNVLDAEMLIRFLAKMSEHFNGPYIRFAKPPEFKVTYG